MKSTYISVAVFSILLFASSLEAKKELQKDEQVPKNRYLGKKDMSFSNELESKPNMPFFFHHYSDSTPDFQLKPNIFDYKSYSNSKNTFEQKPNGPFDCHRYSNGKPKLDYLKPNNPFDYNHYSDFKPKPNPLIYHFYSGTNSAFKPKSSMPFNYHRYSNTKLSFEQKSDNAFDYHRYSDTKSALERKPSQSLEPKYNFPDFPFHNEDMIDKKRLEASVDSNMNVQNSVLKLHSMDVDNFYIRSHDNSPLVIFFRKNDLQVGKKIPLPPLDFPISDPPPLLSREEAESIPFSYKQLPNLLQLFAISPVSPQANAMEEALRFCEAKPIKGETKFCATSFESMLDFVRTTLGLDDFRAVSSAHFTKSKCIEQNYTITQQPKEISASNFIGCHPLSYPYTIFYCHHTANTKSFETSIVGDNGDVIDALVVCHYDTSEWDPDHQAFQQTGTKPGSTEICHFFPIDHMIWIPSQA